MNSVRVRATWMLPALNLIAWLLFLLLRPAIPADELHQQELKEVRERLEPGMSLKSTSGAPYGVFAGRYLYSWSEWHGAGENRWLKALMVVNLPSLLATAVVGYLVSALTTETVPIATRSWLYFVIFLAVSTSLWFAIGTILQKVLIRSRNVRPARAKGAA